MNAKLLLSLPILDNQNNLDSEPKSILVNLTNPNNQYYNLQSRSISPLAEHNTNHLNLSTLSIESNTSTRYEEYELRFQFR
jgi:hypothetical protein